MSKRDDIAVALATVSLEKSTKLTTSMDDLEDSLLTEILIRLPTAKFAIQCQLVSRRWKTLISASYFGRRFMDRRSTEPKPFAPIIRHKEYASDSTNLNFDYHIVFSCDPPIPKCIGFDALGKVLGRFFDAVATHDELLLFHPKTEDKERLFLVYNPITRILFKIPPVPDEFLRRSKEAEEEEGGGGSEAEEEGGGGQEAGEDENYENEGLLIEGFVCVSTSDYGWSYKVVRIPKDGSSKNSFIAQIFSSETNEWAESVVRHEEEFLMDSLAVCFLAWNGLMHWILFDGYVLVYDPYNKPEECYRVKLPIMVSDFTLGICKGSMQLFSVTPISYTNCRMMVWELDDTGKSWTLKHQGDRIEMAVVGPIYPDWGWQEGRPVALHPNEEQIVYLTCFNTRVFLCDLGRKTLELIDELPRNVYPTARVFWRAIPPLLLPSWPTTLP